MAKPNTAHNITHSHRGSLFLDAALVPPVQNMLTYAGAALREMCNFNMGNSAFAIQSVHGVLWACQFIQNLGFFVLHVDMPENWDIHTTLRNF